MTEGPRSRGGSLAYALPISCTALVVGIGFTWGLLRWVRQTAYFVGDDYFGFWLALTGQLSANVMTPVGSQIVPLHRLLDYAIYHLLPVNYAAALSVLAAFHVMTVIYLYRTLEQLGRSAWNPALVCVYVTFTYLWIQLAWWSAGLQRLPFGCLSVMAIFYYLRYTETRRPRYLVAVTVCTLAALGFYGKALLVPLCCAGLDAARARRGPDDARFDLRDKKRWLVLGALVGAQLVFIPVARGLAHEPSGWGNTSASFQLGLVARTFAILGHALLGAQLHYPQYEPSWAVGVGWLLVVAYTVYRARSTAIAWGIASSVLALNMLMIGLSNRSALLGAALPFEPRYYFDLAFVAILFLGAILHQIPQDTPECRWLGVSWRRYVAPLLVPASLLTIGISSFRNVTAHAFEYSRDLPRTRQYMQNLNSDLARLEMGSGEPRTFVDGFIPTFVTGIDMVFRHHSQLFAVLHAPARFVEVGRADFEVNEAGNVVRAHSRRSSRPRGQRGR